MTVTGVVADPDARVTTVAADVAVVGAGLGGVAAALVLREAGHRVVLTDQCDRVGGQITAQGVAALDEHSLVEHAGRTRSYARFRDAVRHHYQALGAPPSMPDGTPLNPGNGWVSRLCFEPHVGQRVLEGWLAESGDDLMVMLQHRPVQVVRDGPAVTAVVLAGPGGALTEVRATVHLDATELGDLLLLAGAPWVTGAESRDDTGEPGALDGAADPDRVQACTVAAAVEFRPGEHHLVPRPKGYERLRASQPFSLISGGRPFRMFTQDHDGPPPFWTYRRLRDGTLVGGRDVTLVNWPANDYVGRSLIGPNPGPDPGAVAAARRLTLAFLHWLQTEAPRDDGGGTGYPELRLAPEVMGTSDGLAAHPYVRESRRLRATRRVREPDLLPPDTTRARAADFADSGGLGWYHLDLHASVGDPTTRWVATHPFQVPLGSLVTARRPNLVAAAKNIGTTHLTNGAYRVHPVEWAVGEAAGCLAATALAWRRAPAGLVDDTRAVLAVQGRLLTRGAPIYWFADLDDRDPHWRPAQMLALAGGLDGDRARTATLRAEVSRPADATSIRALTRAAARLAGHPVDLPACEEPTWGDVVRALGPCLDHAVATVSRE